MAVYPLFPKVPSGSRSARKSIIQNTLDASAEAWVEGSRHFCPMCHGTLAVRGPVRMNEAGQPGWVFTCLKCERIDSPAQPRRRPVVRNDMSSGLVESKRRGRRDVRGALGGLFVSAAFQTAVVVAAVLGTMGVVARTAPALDTMVLTLTEAAAEQEVEEPDPVPLVTTLAPPPKGFQVLEAPVDIPEGIPDIDFDQRFDPRDYSGRGVEGGVFAGVEGGEGPVDQPEVFNVAAVDEIPESIEGPSPQYPSLMRRAGVEGYVDARYIVLDDGTVDPASIVIVASSHPQFEEAAVKAIRKARFRPGRVAGIPVRVLVEQRITFSLT